VSGKVPLAYPEFIFKHFHETHLPLLFDAFWQIVPFGTGGRRGPVGYGPNRINPTTIVLTVQGHCDYLRKVFGAGDISVVVANDVRVFNDFRGVYGFLGNDHPLRGLTSRSFAKLACEVYSANGIICYLAEPESDAAILTTPELSFLISNLGAAGGVNISASHNPPDDNGIKVYDEYGSQPIAPNDQLLIDTMERVTEIHPLPFSEGLARNLIRGISEDHHQQYFDEYLSRFGAVTPPSMNHPVVFTPLCGCGLTTVERALQEIGFRVLVPPDERPDGTFKAIPFRIPNPEVPEATKPAKDFATRQGSEIVFSSDPDADRIGVEIRLHDGSWYHFDGNQIAAMLCYFLMLDKQGPQRKGLVITTLVTTKMLARLAALAGDSWIVDDLLVGFKYIASVIKTIQQTNQYKGRATTIDEFVMAAEESHGIATLPVIRDKDATSGCIYLAALYQRLKDEGRTLLDYYTHMLQEVGEFTETSRSIIMTGADGVFRRDRLMALLRKSPPQSFDGRRILEALDYWDEKVHGRFVSESDKLPRNVIQYTLDSFTVTVRPSGTEPKLKIYCQLLPEQTPSQARGIFLLEAAKEKANGMVEAVYRELLHLMGIDVGPISFLLPDIIDIGCKETFENIVVPQLVQAVNSGQLTSRSAVLAWLRDHVQDLLPGADALPALRSTISFLCKQSFKNCPDVLVAELEEWARS
jgi:phosphoglucomutase/phosphomannomutase